MAGSSVCGSAGMAKVMAPLGAAAACGAGARVAAGAGAAAVGALAGAVVGLAAGGAAVAAADVGGAGAAVWHAVSKAASTRPAPVEIHRLTSVGVLMGTPPFRWPAALGYDHRVI